MWSNFLAGIALSQNEVDLAKDIFKTIIPKLKNFLLGSIKFRFDRKKALSIRAKG